MTTFHCDKLCSGTCCAPLRWALNCEYDDLPSCGCESALCQAQLAADDPAKLAELGAMALRARGMDIGAIHEHADFHWGGFRHEYAWHWTDDKDRLYIAQYVDTKRHWVVIVQLDMPKARAILAAIMATPPDESSREQCEQMIRGET